VSFITDEGVARLPPACSAEGGSFTAPLIAATA